MKALEEFEFLKLNNQIKYYEWGSPEYIPDLLGMKNPEGRPWAELWMGCHPGGPSTVNSGNGELKLGELITDNVQYYLGKQGKYDSLPFLFKLLAAEKPLSIQAHPNLSQAKLGFQREAALAMDAPNRSYKDPNHKPEIICGLTPFSGMCGFREPEAIRELLEDFLGIQKIPSPASSAMNTAPDYIHSSIKPLLIILNNSDSRAALKNFLYTLLNFPPEQRKQLGQYILETGPQRYANALNRENSGFWAQPWKTMIRFAQLYPDDPALLSPLYLNLFELKPTEALFLHPGTLHAYISGFGVELMANSDNVLRGGLTPKYIDMDELMNIIDFSPMKLQIVTPPANTPMFTYPVHCDDFSLTVLNGSKEKENVFTLSPAICIVTSGELELSGKTADILLKPGESVFIPSASHPVFRGNYTVYAASIPAIHK